MPRADGKGVWSWPPDAGVKFAGDDPQMTVAIKPGHRGERVISRKPSCRECRIVSAYLWFLTRVLSTFAHEAAGVPNTRHSLRPQTFEGHDDAKLGQIAVA